MDRPDPIGAWKKLDPKSQAAIGVGFVGVTVYAFIRSRRPKPSTEPAPAPDPDTASIPGGRSGSFGSGGGAGGSGGGGKTGTGTGGGGTGTGSTGTGTGTGTGGGASGSVGVAPASSSRFLAPVLNPDQNILATPSDLYRGTYAGPAVEGEQRYDADWFNGTNDPYSPNGTVTARGKGGYFGTGTAGYSPSVIAGGGAKTVVIGRPVNFEAPNGDTLPYAQDANRLSLGGGARAAGGIVLEDYAGQTAPAFLLKIAATATPAQLQSPEFVADFNKQNAELGGTLRLSVQAPPPPPAAPPPPAPVAVTPVYVTEVPPMIVPPDDGAAKLNTAGEAANTAVQDLGYTDLNAYWASLYEASQRASGQTSGR